MGDINREFLSALMRLYRENADGTLSVELGTATRTIVVLKGHLVSSHSNLPAERLGDLLVAQGRLDPDLVEPMAAEAQRRGMLLGDQLVSDKLIEPGELATALENQALLRFERMWTMTGATTTSPLPKNLPQVMRRPLGPLVLDTFRKSMAIDGIERMTRGAVRGSYRIASDGDSRASALTLTAPELRVLRRLTAGEEASTILRSSPQPELAMRTTVALLTLGIVVPR